MGDSLNNKKEFLDDCGCKLELNKEMDPLAEEFITYFEGFFLSTNKNDNNYLR